MSENDTEREDTSQFRIRVDSESVRMRHTIRRLWVALGVVGGAVTAIGSVAFGVGMWRARLAKAEDVEQLQVSVARHAEQIDGVAKHLDEDRHAIEKRLDYITVRLDKTFDEVKKQRR